MQKKDKKGWEISVMDSGISQEQAEELLIDYEENTLLIAEFEPHDIEKGG